MRAYESDCVRPYIWAAAEELLARLFASTTPDAAAPEAEGAHRTMPTFEDALAQHYPELSLPDPEPTCDREAMFDKELVVHPSRHAVCYVRCNRTTSVDCAIVRSACLCAVCRSPVSCGRGSVDASAG